MHEIIGPQTWGPGDKIERRAADEEKKERDPGEYPGTTTT